MNAALTLIANHRVQKEAIETQIVHRYLMEKLVPAKNWKSAETETGGGITHVLTLLTIVQQHNRTALKYALQVTLMEILIAMSVVIGARIILATGPNQKAVLQAGPAQALIATQAEAIV